MTTLWNLIGIYYIKNYHLLVTKSEVIPDTPKEQPPPFSDELSDSEESIDGREQNLSSPAKKELKTQISSLADKNFALMEVHDFFSDHEEINIEIPDEINSFLEKLNKSEPLENEDLVKFRHWFFDQSKTAQDVIINIIYSISLSIYKNYEEEINHSLDTITKSLYAKIEIPQETRVDEHCYAGLFNCYKLFRDYIPFNISEHYIPNSIFPNISYSTKNLVRTNIPFALNAFMLVGKLEKTDPLYPLNIKRSVITNPHVGIKHASQFYPFKNIEKRATDLDPDNCAFIMTDGKKLFFVRAQFKPEHAINSVLGSEIAKVIDIDCFASESLFSNFLVGSKKFDHYETPITAPNELLKILSVPKVHPGVATMDELTNFIDELDDNLENYSLYNNNFAKIDFGSCNMITPIAKEDYEKNNFSIALSNAAFIRNLDKSSIYAAPEILRQAKDYIQEKFYVRLKLCMIPDLLIKELVKKSCANSEKDSQYTVAFNECLNRRTIALQLWIEDPNNKVVFSENPDYFNKVLKKCVEEITSYIQIEKHKFSIEKRLILNDLENRTSEIIKQIYPQQQLKEAPSVSYSISPSPQNTQILKSFSQGSLTDAVDNPHTLSELNSFSSISTSIGPSISYSFSSTSLKEEPEDENPSSPRRQPFSSLVYPKDGLFSKEEKHADHEEFKELTPIIKQ